MRRLKVFGVLLIAVSILLTLGAAPVMAAEQSGGDASAQSFDALIHVGYLSVLHRLDEPGEYAAWWDALQGGTVTRAGFAGAIVNSHEKSYLMVAEYYSDFLGRAATYAEANAWANAMDAGLTWRGVRSKLMASSEFAAYYGAGNDNDYIMALYNIFLMRDAGAGEISAWVAAMNAGVSREAVANRVAMSTEYTYPYVVSRYNYYLSRHPDPAETAMWANPLSTGTIDEEDIDAGLVGSDEFFWHWFIFGAAGFEAVE